MLTGHSRKEHDESKQSPGRPMAGDPGSRETGFKGSTCTAHDVPWAWHSHRGKNQESHAPSSKQVRLHTYTVMETEPDPCCGEQEPPAAGRVGAALSPTAKGAPSMFRGVSL